MEKTSSKSVNWSDWALVGVRCAFLLFVALILFTARTSDGLPVYQNNSIVTTLAIGFGATVLLAVFALIPAVSPIMPLIVMLGDWAITAGIIYISKDNPLLLIATTGVIIFSGALRLGPLWGSVQSVGVIVAAILALLANYGSAQINTVLSNLLHPLLISGLFAVIANIWAFAVQGQITNHSAQMVATHRSQASQLTDMQERARAIYEMSAALSRTLDYEDILTAALNGCAQGLRELERRGKERLIGVAMLMRAKDNALYVVTDRGLPLKDKSRTITGQSGIVGRALAQGEPIIEQGARKDPELQYFVAFQETRSIICIPLRAGYDNYGVLIFGSDKPHAFTEEQTELLRTIAIQATVALQNAALYNNLLSERDRIIAADEEARKKLARDLHDGPTQTISAIAMRMAIIARMLERTPDEVPKELKKIEDLARRTTKEIRHMLFTLRPLVLENQGLKAALEQLAEKLHDTYDQNVKVYVASEVENLLDGHQQGVIFYIIEEAVNNARKHAEAEVINVSLHKHEDVVMVQIIDNGKGFDTKAVLNNYEKRGSLGMINLQERAQLVEGALSLESAPGKGTKITVLVPIKDVHGSGLDKQARKTIGQTPKVAAAAVSRFQEDQ